MAHWGMTFKWWGFVLIMFFLGHSLDLVRQNSDTLSSQNAALFSKNVGLDSVCTEAKNELRVSDAANKSRADTLAIQNRDQQNTINNCQEKAIALLAPPELKISTGLITFEATVNNKPATAIFVIGVTNKPIAPIDVNVTCNADIQLVPINNQPMQPRLVGVGLTSESGIWRVDQRTVRVHIQNPAWTPNNPLSVPVLAFGRRTVGVQD